MCGGLFHGSLAESALPCAGLSLEPANVALIKDVLSLDQSLSEVVVPEQQACLAAAYLASTGATAAAGPSTKVQGTKLMTVLKGFRR